MYFVQEWELLVLEALKWNIYYLTPYDFLDVVLWQINSLITTADQRCTIKRHAQTFANICVAGNNIALSYNYLVHYSDNIKRL